jgi:hypothetical protein
MMQYSCGGDVKRSKAAGKSCPNSCAKLKARRMQIHLQGSETAARISQGGVREGGSFTRNALGNLRNLLGEGIAPSFSVDTSPRGAGQTPAPNGRAESSGFSSDVCRINSVGS